MSLRATTSQKNMYSKQHDSNIWTFQNNLTVIRSKTHAIPSFFWSCVFSRLPAFQHLTPICHPAPWLPCNYQAFYVIKRDLLKSGPNTTWWIRVNWARSVDRKNAGDECTKAISHQLLPIPASTYIGRTVRNLTGVRVQNAGEKSRKATNTPNISKLNRGLDPNDFGLRFMN